MKDAFEKMPESFLDWLLKCPVPWIRIKINENTVHYSFDAPDEEEEEAQASFVLVRELAALEALQAKQNSPQAGYLAAHSPQVINKKKKVRK